MTSNTKKVSGKRPKVPMSKAVVGHPKVASFFAIDPARTPCKAYTKRTK